MARQTSNAARAIGLPGQATHQSGDIVDSFRLTAVASDGQFVVRDGTGCRPLADGDTLTEANFLGVIMRPQVRAPGAYEVGNLVSVMRRGRILVTVSASVAAGNPVYAGVATAQLGQVDDATGTGLGLVPRARFESSASASGLAIVEVGQ